MKTQSAYLLIGTIRKHDGMFEAFDLNVPDLSETFEGQREQRTETQIMRFEAKPDGSYSYISVE